MNPNHNFFSYPFQNRSLFLGLLIQTIFSIQQANGQAIGGIRDSKFNALDKGKNYNQGLFNPFTSIIPTKEKSYFVLYKWAINIPHTYTGRKPGGIEFVRDYPLFQKIDGFPWPSTNVHEVVSLDEDKVAVIASRTKIFPYYTSIDFDSITIQVVRDSINTASTLNFNPAFGFTITNAFSGDYRFGLLKGSPNHYYFFLTCNQDSTLKHNQVAVLALDSSFTPIGQKRIFSGIGVETGAVDLQGNLILLGRAMVGIQPGNSAILKLNQSLNPISGAFPLLPLDLVAGKIQTMAISGDGKLKLSGTIKRNGQVQQAQIRLNPDGSFDGGFSSLILPVLATFPVWQSNRNGNTYVAWQEGTDYPYQCKMVEINPSGSVLRQASFIPPMYSPIGRPLTFHTGYDAFLFETGDVVPATQFKTLSSAANVIPITYMPAARNRFWVSFQQGSFPMANVDGLVSSFNNSGAIAIPKANPANNRVLVQNNFIQAQKKLLPGLAILNDSGMPDKDFRGLLSFPEPYRTKYLTYTSVFDDRYSNTSYAFFPMAAKKLLVVENADTLSNTFSDTVRRFTFSGRLDSTFVPYRVNSDLIPIKGKKYAALHFTDAQGRPVLNTDGRPDVKTTLLILDSLGNLLQTLGEYQNLGSADTNILSLYRNRKIMVQDNLGGIWIGNTAFLSQRSKVFYVRFSTSGERTVHRFDSLSPSFRSVKIQILNNKNLKFFANFGHLTIGRYHEIMFDSAGKYLSRSAYALPDGFAARNGGLMFLQRVLPDGKYLCSVRKPSGGDIFYRFQPSGQLDPSFLPIETSDEGYWPSLAILGDKLIMCAGSQIGYSYWSTRHYYNWIGDSYKNGLYAFKLNSLEENRGFVQGKIEQVASPASGCNPSGTRTPTRFSMLRTDNRQIALTNQQGFYSFALEPGNYKIRQEMGNDALRRQICPIGVDSSLMVTTTQGGVELNQNFINQTFNCPRLTMNLLQPRFRLCAKNNFTIRYRNDGMGAEPNARIKLNLPELVRIYSATSPYTTLPDSSVVFDIGNLEPGQGGSISITDTIGCPTTPDSSQRACFSARMEPISVCSEVNPAAIGWSGAWLDAKARYNPATDKVRYTLFNRGTDMLDSTKVSIASLGTVFVNTKVKMIAGDSLSWNVEPITVLHCGMYVEQPANCPLGTSGTLFHTGRNTAASYLSFQDGWLMNQTTTACPPFRYSYDPNEKIVDPTIPVEPGAELTYTIHFENYGNDTAYAVIVADTLPTGLDITTFRMTGSSHDCEPRLAGTLDNPVVFFNFLPIKLPGKKQDSVLSKGQVDFKIRLKPNVALGSIHQNKAHIYFDRNEAIITNTTVTKVRDPDEPTEVSNSISQNKELIVYPNPNQGSFTIRLPKGFENQEISLTDIQGKLVMRPKTLDDKSLSVNYITPGIYFVFVSGLKPVKIIISK